MDVLKYEDDQKMETCDIVGLIIYYLKKLMTLTLTGTALLSPIQKCYQLSKLKIEFDVMKEMYAALGTHTCSEKTTF